MMHIGGIYNLKGEYHYAASEGCFGIANSDKFSSNAYTNKILDSHPLKTIFQHKACTVKLYADSFYKVQKNSHSSFEVICCRS